MNVGLFCKARGLSCQSVDGLRHSQISNNHDLETRNDEPVSQIQATSDSVLQTTQDVNALVDPVDANSSHSIYSPTTSINFMDPWISYIYLHPIPRNHSELMMPNPSTYTLEDNKNRTAHSMGLAAEQDAYLLASFPSVIVTETNLVASDIVQVEAKNVPRETIPLHFNILQNSFMPYDKLMKDDASHTIALKVGRHGPDLVRLYFKHVHPMYCIVSKVRFLRAYNDDKLSIPTSLRAAVYALGSAYWEQDSTLKATPRPFQQWELFLPAQVSLERELEAPNLWRMQACLLMSHDRAAGNTVFETPRIWTTSAQTVACAQMIGLHRDPSDWKLASWEKSLRKKLWWATYVTDTWCSVSHGNPPLIYPMSFTTSDVDMSDMEFDEDVPDDLRNMVDKGSVGFEISNAARFVELVKLTQLLHALIDTAL